MLQLLSRMAFLYSLFPVFQVAGFPRPPPIWTWSGSSHFDFGKSLGARFAADIKQRYVRDPDIGGWLEPWAKTSQGKQVVSAFLATHMRLFPEYVQELYGMANGTDLTFEQLFLKNLEPELSYFAPYNATYTATRVSHCSDIAVAQAGGKLFLAHNEDSSYPDAFINASVAGKPTFFAYTYLGVLPSGAFGSNSHIAFTLNSVFPAHALLGGIGRAFISRQLLEATTMDEALAIATQPGQSTGHNFQLLEFSTGKIFNVEVAYLASTGTVSIATDVGQVPSQYVFHANQYQFLRNSSGHIIAQFPDPSSEHRQARAKQMGVVANISRALTVLGDTQDSRYPIWRGVNETLATVVLDGRAKTMQVFRSGVNPRKKQLWKSFSL